MWSFEGRFYIIEMVWECLKPAVTDRFAIVDQRAHIQTGDLCRLGIRDYREAGLPDGVYGIVKWFGGVSLALGYVECTCTNPPRTIHTGLANLRLAHRIVVMAPTLQSAERLLRKVRRDPDRFGSLLAP